MVAVRTPEDLADYVEKLAQKVYDLEQRGTSSASTALPTDPTFNSVTVDTNVLDSSINPVTAWVATYPQSGIFLGQVFIDAQWNAPTGPNPANEYQLEIARRTSPGVYQAPQQYRTSGTALRIENLLPGTTYGLRVFAINKLGISSTAFPVSGYTDVTTSVDATIPTNVTWPAAGFLGAGLRSVMAVWNDSTDFDFDVYELQIATNAGFTTGPGPGNTPQSIFPRGSLGQFTNLAVATQYWVRVRAYDTSGNVSASWTSPSTPNITTQTLQAGDIPTNYITTVMIGDAQITTLKVLDGNITNAKIQNLDVTKVNAGTISSKDFVLGSGGQIKTAAITPGFILNSTGLTFYDNSGNPVSRILSNGTVQINGIINATGGTFSGSITASGTITGGILQGATVRSAASGARSELVGGDITVYESDGTTVRFRVGTSQSYMTIPGGGSGSTGFGFRSTGNFVTFTIGGTMGLALKIDTSPGIYFGDFVFSDRLQYNSGSRSLEWDGAPTGAGPGGIKVNGTAGGISNFSGDWGGGGGGVRGRTGHTISFDWRNNTGPLDFYVENTLVKTFVVPHPTDPKRYLVHGALEGPTADVFYRGRGLLQPDGTALIVLPAYFEALTVLGSETVTVTPIYSGIKSPTTLEPSEVFRGRFTVTKTAGPGERFFYEVKAERKGTRFGVEPLRTAVKLRGDGPYTYLIAA